MQRLEVSGAVRPIYGSLGVKRLNIFGRIRNIACKWNKETQVFSCLPEFFLKGIWIIVSNCHFFPRWTSICYIHFTIRWCTNFVVGNHHKIATSPSIIRFVARYIPVENLVVQGLRIVCEALYFQSIRACRQRTVGVRLLYETRCFCCGGDHQSGATIHTLL